MSTETSNGKVSQGKVSMGQLGGWRGLLRNPGLVIHTWRAGAHIGQDADGNNFYQQRRPQKGQRPRRWVVFAGAVESSAIGPEWHSWLHGLTDSPLPATNRQPWQKPHIPNQTGTQASYRPAGHDYQGGKRAHTPADYEPWTPDQH